MGHPIHKHMNSGISRYSVEKGPHAKHGDAPHRNSSPVNNMQHDSMKDEARHQHMMKEHPAKPPTSRKSSPLDAHASKGRSGHPTHMQAGNDNSGNPNAASADEYWRVHQQTSHHKSPANNITYGDKSGPTGYIGEQRADDMKYNPVDDKAGMSRQKYGGNKGDEKRSAKKDYDGMSRYGGNKGDIKRSATKDYDSPASIRKANSTRKDDEY
jgi:hypothetical protein